MFALLSRALSHPAIGSILTALACTTAFSAGLIANIGFAILPIIDKMDLLVTLAFYAAILSIIIRMSVLWWTSIGVDVVRPALGPAVSKLALRIRPGILVGLATVVVAIVGIILLFRYQLLGLVWVGSWIILSGIFVALSGRLDTPKQRILFNALQLVALCTFSAAGYTWGDVQRSVGPKAVIDYLDAGKAEQPASLISTSSTGIIAFFPDDPETHVIPWAAIGEIRTYAPDPSHAESPLSAHPNLAAVSPPAPEPRP